MWIREVDERRRALRVAVPLTRPRSETRIKKRGFFNEYGLPVATRQEAFSQSCYVEWQIGYDVVVTDDDEKLKRTTIKDAFFTAANGKTKTLYELSEYIYYFYKWGLVGKGSLEDIGNFLRRLTDDDFIDNPKKFAIERTHPTPVRVSGLDFSYTQVKYPLLIHKFGPFEILAEIKVTEKQYAVGVQPMLYFCFPITELKADVPLLGRAAEAKETADFIIDAGNIPVFLAALKIFGLLSKSHNGDILAIIDRIMA